MSKPPKFDFKQMIAGESAVPDIGEAEAPGPAPVSAEVVHLDPAAPARAAGKNPKPAGQGTLKCRSVRQSLYLEPPVYEQLRELAFHERKPMHGLVLEGLDLLFRKRDLKSLKQLDDVAK